MAQQGKCPIFCLQKSLHPTAHTHTHIPQVYPWTRYVPTGLFDIQYCMYGLREDSMPPCRDTLYCIAYVHYLVGLWDSNLWSHVSNCWAILHSSHSHITVYPIIHVLVQWRRQHVSHSTVEDPQFVSHSVQAF